jgi:hypothetical protein
MRSLFNKRRRFRHGRDCPGHPRRCAQRGSQNIAHAAGNEILRVLKLTSYVTAWMAGTSPAITQVVPIKPPLS